MKAFGELFQTADWKTEKHVPVIECQDRVKAGELFPVKVTLGKEIAHPNTTESNTDGKTLRDIV
jgi:superoxide reductase